ncbi:MAG: polysaccharide biosynthesis tyrosine autokinase [Pseudomonadota bacterium]
MSQKVSLELLSNGRDAVDGGQDQLFADLKSVILLAIRRIVVISVTAALIFGAVAFVTLTQTPIYKATATVIVDSRQTNVIDLGAVLSGAALNTAVIDTEVRVIESKALLARVAEKEQLILEPEFNPYLPVENSSGPLDWIMNILPGGGDDMADLPPPTEEDIQEAILENLIARSSANRIGTTYLIDVTVWSESAEMAARLANSIAEQYGVEQLETKLEATERATRWLADRVDALQQEVTTKETMVEDFRNASGLITAQGATLTESNIAMLQSEKVQLEANLARSRARYNGMRRQLNNGAGADALGEVLDSPVVAQLKTQLAEAQRKVAELEATYGPRYPALMAARNEVADYTTQIDSEVRRIVENLRVEVEVAEDQIAGLQGRISSSRALLVRNNSAQVRLNELERDAESSRLILSEFVQRFRETREQDELVESDARVLSGASVPLYPSSPRKTLNFLIGIILGGLFGFALAILLEIFDNKIRSLEEIERKFGIPGIGSVPYIKSLRILGFGVKDPGEFLVHNPLSAFAESMRFLRASIAIAQMEDDTKTVTVTSALPNEGKTSVTLSLGRMSALSGDKTLIIDGDFRRRQLTTSAGISPDNGLVEYLMGECKLEDAIYKDKFTDMEMLALKPEGEGIHDVFGSRKFDDLLRQLKEQYDLILIDTGPLLLMAEAGIIASKTDKTLMVIRWQGSRRTATRRALEVLKSMKTDLLGAALNMVDLTQHRHHSEESARSKGYGKYYTKDQRIHLFLLAIAEAQPSPTRIFGIIFTVPFRARRLF